MDDLPLKKEHNNCLLGSCQTLPENSTNNRELGELNETMDAREKTGSHPLQTLLRPGEWDKVLPYVHLPQLTAHIRKGLFKRGNNEGKRDGVMAPPLFLLQIYQDYTLEMAEINAEIKMEMVCLHFRED